MTVGGPESRVEERELGCVPFSRTVCRQQTDIGTPTYERHSASHMSQEDNIFYNVNIVKIRTNVK